MEGKDKLSAALATWQKCDKKNREAVAWVLAQHAARLENARVDAEDLELAAFEEDCDDSLAVVVAAFELLQAAGEQST